MDADGAPGGPTASAAGRRVWRAVTPALFAAAALPVGVSAALLLTGARGLGGVC